MRIEFNVDGYPPKKSTAKSMWSQPTQAELVLQLREKAYQIREKVGLSKAFSSDVSIHIRLNIREEEFYSIGDLDNFIGGVCDGLQAAHENVRDSLHDLFFDKSRCSVPPDEPLLINNDEKVISIRAEKISIENDQNPYYHIIVEEIN